MTTQSKARTRRGFLGAAGTGVGGLALSGLAGAAEPRETPRRTFVLVHGAWHGGWCWRRVADLLERAGHKVYTPTLTGLGERSHLLDDGIDLETHVQDVVNLFAWEDLEDAVLCAHSYGSWVISCVVEQVLSQVASIVFVDSFMPEDGQSGLSTAPPAARESVEKALKEGAISRPAPPAAALHVNEKDRAWVDAKMTPQPIGVSLQKIRLTGAVERVGKKAYVRAADFPSAGFDRFLAAAEAKPGWRAFSVPGGHDLMVDNPHRLAEILLELA